MSSSQPYKVWDHAREQKKCLVAKSLQDLIAKGRSKFGWPLTEVVTAVLECDGTEVADQDYFSCLPSNTTFVLLTKGQQWSASSGTDEDAVDSAVGGRVYGIASPASRTDRQTPHIIKDIIVNPAELLTLSEEQMMEVVNADAKAIADELSCDTEKVEQAQWWVQRNLDDRENIRESKALLELLHKVAASPPGT